MHPIGPAARLAPAGAQPGSPVPLAASWVERIARPGRTRPGRSLDRGAGGARSLASPDRLEVLPRAIGSAVARDVRERFQKPWPLLQGEAEAPIKEQPGDGTRF
jgi:hypothetical protein